MVPVGDTRTGWIITLVALALISEVYAFNTDSNMNYEPYVNEDMPSLTPYVTDEYIRHMRSMIRAYRGDVTGDQLIIETNALVDTKYRTWKRNADMINSLLALPKGLNDAGR